MLVRFNVFNVFITKIEAKIWVKLQSCVQKTVKTKLAVCNINLSTKK